MTTHRDTNNTRLSSLLALALMLGVVLACSSPNEGGNTATSTATTPAATVETKPAGFTFQLVEMRKDDGSGSPASTATTAFKRADSPIYCYTEWATGSYPGTKLRFVWTQVDAGRVKNKVIDEENVTLPADKSDFGASKITFDEPPPAGNYKVDVYIDDKLDRSVPFTIE